MKHFALVTALSLTSLTAQSQEPEIDTKAFDAFAERLIAQFDVPGMAVAIVHRDKVVLAKGYGHRDVEKKQPVDGDTLFAIGSSSKAFTALGVALLVEDGALAFDDPVRKHLPEIRMHDDYASEHLTVEGLLCHRSGLPRHDLTWYGAKRSRADLVWSIRWLEPSRPFRTAWQYQNLMFMTAGYLVGQKSKSTWERFTDKRILAPLGMQRTNFSVTKCAKDENAARPYGKKKDKVARVPYRNIDAVGPAGSINSTAKDMAQWLRMLLGAGKLGAKQIAAKRTIAALMRPRVVMPGNRGGKEFGYQTYALGWMVQTYRGQLMVHHGGNIDGFSAMVALLPDLRCGVVVLTNLNGNRTVALPGRWVADHLAGAKPIDWIARTKRAAARQKKAAEAAAKKINKKAAVAGTSPAHALGAYAGSYEHKGYGTIRIAKKDSGLTFQLNGLKGPLVHRHYETFELGGGRGKGTKLQFVTDVDGGIESISIRLEKAIDPIVFARKAAQRLSDPEFLDQLVGSYALAGKTVEVSRRQQTLLVTVPGQPTYECVPAKGIRFALKKLKGYAVEFELDQKGRAEAMVFDQPNGRFTAKRVKK